MKKKNKEDLGVSRQKRDTIKKVTKRVYTNGVVHIIEKTYRINPYTGRAKLIGVRKNSEVAIPQITGLKKNEDNKSTRTRSVKVFAGIENNQVTVKIDKKTKSIEIKSKGTNIPGQDHTPPMPPMPPMPQQPQQPRKPKKPQKPQQQKQNSSKQGKSTNQGIVINPAFEISEQ